MTARLELLKVTRRAPDIRYQVRVTGGEVTTGTVVLLKRGRLLIGHGRIARITGGSGAPRRLRRGDEGEIGFKVQIGLSQAARGDALDEVEGDLAEALAEAVADEVAATPIEQRILMLPMRIVTAFGSERIDGQLTGVLKVRAYPDAPHIVPGSGAWTDSDEEMARLYHAARTEGRAAEARAREELVATVGPDHAARLMAGDRTERPVRATALPHRLNVAVDLRMGNTRERVIASGALIPEDVPLDMAKDNALLGGRGDPLAWLHDYDAALALGLAVSVPLPPADTRIHVERLTLAGTPRAQDYGRVLAQKSALESTQLAGAGTPMKGDTLPDHPPTTEGQKRVGRYLGTPVDGVAGDDLHPLAAQLIWHGAFEPALWRGLGVVSGLPRTNAEQVLSALRSRFIDDLRPEGPCPTVVLGDLPYGILPVLPEVEDMIAPDPAMFAHLAHQAAEAQSDLQHQGDWAALVASLSHHDQPRQVFTRAMAEGQFELDLTAKRAAEDPKAGRDRANLVSATWGAADNLLKAHGITRDHRTPSLATRAVGAREAPRLCGPLLMVDAEQDMGQPAPEYLRTVLDRTGGDLLEWPYELYPSNHPDSSRRRVAALTEVLLVATVRDHLGRAAAHILAEGDLQRRMALEALGATAPRQGVPRGWKRLLATVVGDLDAFKDTPLIEIIDRVATRATDQGADKAVALMDTLRRVLETAAELADYPAPRVHRALAGALDLAATRFDAWHIAAATQTLDQLSDQPALVSAYGVVEDFEKRGAGSGERAFTVAPGLDHAATSAVLSAAQRELAHRGLPDISEVDLSPKRVTAALELAGALQTGTPAEEVLGRRVLAHFRAAPGTGPALEALALAFPLDGRSPGQFAAEPDPQLSIDGIALLEAFEAQGTIRQLNLRGQRIDIPQDVLGGAIDLLRDQIDALNDLLFAEGVHGLCAGRPDRAKAAFDALGFGGPTPRRFDVLEASPDTVELELVAGALLDAADPAPGAHALSEAFPAAAVLADHLLGPPMGAATVTEVFPLGVTKERLVPLSELGLSPLEWLSVAPVGGALEDAVRALVAWTLPKDTRPSLDLDTSGGTRGRTPPLVFDPVLPQGTFGGRISLPGGLSNELDALMSAPPRVTSVTLNATATDWLWLLGRAQAAMARVRGITAEDVPGSDATDTAPPATAENTDHQDALSALARRLATAADHDAARMALREAARAGVLHLMPVWPFDPATPTTAEDGAKALGAALIAAQEAGQPLVASPPPLAGTVELPGDSPAQWLTTPGDLAQWVEEMAQVRPTLAPLADLILTSASPGPWTVLQWYDHPDATDPAAPFIGQWVDVDSPADRSEALAVLDLRAAGQGAKHLTGFVFDRWAERAARPERTLGLTVTQDRPTARPGQALLVTAAPKAGMTLDALFARPALALDMAKTRMLHHGDWPTADRSVDPLVDGLGQLLPLLWLGAGDSDPATCSFPSPDPDLL